MKPCIFSPPVSPLETTWVKVGRRKGLSLLVSCSFTINSCSFLVITGYIWGCRVQNWINCNKFTTWSWHQPFAADFCADESKPAERYRKYVHQSEDWNISILKTKVCRWCFTAPEICHWRVSCYSDCKTQQKDWFEIEKSSTRILCPACSWLVDGITRHW